MDRELKKDHMKDQSVVQSSYKFGFMITGTIFDTTKMKIIFLQFI